MWQQLVNIWGIFGVAAAAEIFKIHELGSVGIAALISLYFYSESTEWWVVGLMKYWAAAIEGQADSVCYQTSHSGGSLTPAGLGATYLKAKCGGWSRGKWLSNTTSGWINQWLSVYWLRPKCGTSRKIISGSLTFHFKLSPCVDNPPKSEKNNHPIATKARSSPAIHYPGLIPSNEDMPGLVLSLILCPIQSVCDPVSCCYC